MDVQDVAPFDESMICLFNECKTNKSILMSRTHNSIELPIVSMSNTWTDSP
jgi:hypothetical protein